MLKLLISCLMILLSFQSSTIYAQSSNQKTRTFTCDPQLKSCLTAMQKLPEIRTLIEQVLKEGPLTIAVKNTNISDKFGAFWDVDKRVIFVGISSPRDEGSLIGSILFELHNASVNSEFNRLDHLASRGEINRDSYVEAMEYLEYVNSINASKIAQKGISMGIFPENARLHTYRDFEEHFHYQKISGHSDCIADIFDQVAPLSNRR